MKTRKRAIFALALLGLGITTIQARSQTTYTPYAFTNFAGLPGTYGTNDGIGGAARFNNPTGVGVDDAGSVYVADSGNHSIRKITSAGVVSTLAGSAGQAGTNDGIGSAARFNSPTGVTVDSLANVYVADFYNDTIRRITPDGVVTTLAGSAGQPGTNDGIGPAARFNLPFGVAVDGAGTLYVADAVNYAVRKIAPTGTNWAVTTLAGSVRQFGTSDGAGSAARFYVPTGVAVDGATNLFVADTANYTIRKITPTGMVTTLAGTPREYGAKDGVGSAARFGSFQCDPFGCGYFGPVGTTVDRAANVYVADEGNNTIRRITPAGAVSTLAGSTGEIGSDDGVGSAARFNYPAGVAVDSAGNIYLADTENHRITKGRPVLQFDAGWGLGISNGPFQARLIGPSANEAVIETSVDLNTWTPIQTNALPSGGLDVSVPIGVNPYQFFRARLVP